MQNVNQCYSPCSGQAQTAVYDKLQQSSNFQLAAASSERSADITIMTDDKDVVSLSIDSSVRAVALTYDEKARTDSSYSERSGRLVGIDVDRQVELSIEGHLNDQERKEIKQVLKAIFGMVKDFLAGKFGKGLDKAEEFGDLETIANVSAEFEAKDSSAYVSQSVAQEITQVQTPAPRREPRPSDAGQSRPPVVNPEVYAKPMPAVSAKPAKAPVEVLADKMTEVVKDSGVDPAKIQKPVDEMFGRLMHKFLNEGPFSFRKMRRLSSLMEEFSRKMNTLMNPEKPEAPTLEPFDSEAVEQVSPAEIFTVKQSTVQTKVSIFEQSFSFNFEYSAAEKDEAADEEVSVEEA